MLPRIQPEIINTWKRTSIDFNWKGFNWKTRPLQRGEKPQQFHHGGMCFIWVGLGLLKQKERERKCRVFPFLNVQL